MRTFHGIRTEHGAVVIVEGDEQNGRPLDLRLDLRNHSPTGFEWGYGGSGPAQLALAMCAAVVGDRRAQAIYQEFKSRVIAGISASEWWFDEEAVLRDIERMERAAGSGKG